MGIKGKGKIDIITIWLYNHIYMDAILLLHEKKLVYHKKKKELAIVEIKVWIIPKDKTSRPGFGNTGGTFVIPISDESSSRGVEISVLSE